MTVVGIDVSKDKLDVVCMDEQRQTQYAQVDNTAKGYAQLKRWLHKRQVQAVCLEATGRYSEGVAEYLHEAGYQVSVVNPARIRGYATSQLRRNKTDKLDAALIADFCRTQQPEAWTPPSPALRQLQQWVRHLEDLTKARQQAQNHLEDPALVAGLVQHWQAHISLLDAQIAQTQQAISDLLNHQPELKQQTEFLRSIPGLGDLTTGKLLSSSRHLPAFPDLPPLLP